MTTHKRNAAELKQRLAGRWVEALRFVAPQLSEALDKPGTNVRCPIDGDERGFRVFKDVNERGGGWKQNWIDDGALTDGFAVLMAVTGKGFVEIYDALNDYLEGCGSIIESKRSSSHSKPAQRVDDEKLRSWLTHIWHQSVSLNDSSSTLGRRYLASRAIEDVSIKGDVFRFHEALPYRYDGVNYGTYPALLAPIRNNSGETIAIHRIFLSKEGTKLNVSDINGKSSPARLQTPSVHSDDKGLVVMTGKQALNQARRFGVIGIAEGIETALSVQKGADIPVWSCLNATNLHSFRPPAGIHSVLIFVDDDKSKTGILAAKRARNELEMAGFNVELLLPDMVRSDDRKSVDWADQLMIDPEAFVRVKALYYGQASQKRVQPL